MRLLQRYYGDSVVESSGGLGESGEDEDGEEEDDEEDWCTKIRQSNTVSVARDDLTLFQVCVCSHFSYPAQLAIHVRFALQVIVDTYKLKLLRKLEKRNKQKTMILTVFLVASFLIRVTRSRAYNVPKYKLKIPVFIISLPYCVLCDTKDCKHYHYY